MKTMKEIIILFEVIQLDGNSDVIRYIMKVFSNTISLFYRVYKRSYN
jgi:hypothetical protein